MDITAIIHGINDFFRQTGKSVAEANEVNKYLESKGLLSFSTKGQPLRKLLREGKIPTAEQPGGKNTTWYLHPIG